MMPRVDLRCVLAIMVTLMIGAPACAQNSSPVDGTQGYRDALHAGMQAYGNGDFDDAVQDFKAAQKLKPRDPLAGLWLGIAQVASGDASKGYFTLEFALEGGSPLAAMDFELSALAHWQQGDTGNAKSVVQHCKLPLCKSLANGIEGGASAPDPRNWPKIVGLDKITAARATAWSP